jgi:tyrosyl-tRNA synthetase
MVGDPGGRSEERNLLDEDTLRANVASIKAQISRILGPEGPWALVDNYAWTRDLPLLAFLRDVGKHVTVNQMLARESVKARIASEHGISYTEFSYMLLQANDYLWLHDHEGCELQIGGSDQWGNILSGVDLIRRSRGGAVHALAWPLLTAPDGTKLGKTTGARTWLDPARTSPYQLYQHWMQIDDRQVAQMLAQLTLLPMDDVNDAVAVHEQAPEQRSAQRLLAREVTTLVHGAVEAAAAEAAAAIMFGAPVAEATPEALEQVAREVNVHRVPALDGGRDVIDLVVEAELTASKGEARRALAQGGLYVNNVPAADGARVTADDLLFGRWVLLRRGKKAHALVEVTG